MNNNKKKAWYYWRNKKDNKWYILALVNGKGACSLRQWNAQTGLFKEVLYEKGDFQDKFAEYLKPPSIHLELSRQPNLIKECGKKLPEWVLKEIKNQVSHLDVSFIITKGDWLFGKLKRYTPLELVRRRWPAVRNYDFTDKWVLGNTVLAFVLLSISYPSGVKLWEWPILIYAAWRTLSILVYLINVVLFDPYRKSIDNKPYFLLSSRRSVIHVILNYLEILVWFAIFYRNFNCCFNERVIQLNTFSGSFYHSVVTMSTLGYGDITPDTTIGICLIIAQTLIGLFMILLVLARFMSMLYKPKSIE